MMTDYELVRNAIAHVRETVGEEHLSLATKIVIEGLEKEMSRGREIIKSEMDQLNASLLSDLRFKANADSRDSNP